MYGMLLHLSLIVRPPLEKLAATQLSFQNLRFAGVMQHCGQAESLRFSSCIKTFLPLFLLPTFGAQGVFEGPLATSTQLSFRHFMLRRMSTRML